MASDVSDPTIWNNPSRWFNADESGFPLCPKSGKVLSSRGIPNIYNFTASDKTQVTVLACMNAMGYFLKPMMVYPGVRFSYNPLERFPFLFFGRTESGWMDSELFVTWLSEVFEPALSEREIKHPVVLFVDRHSTHCTLAASKFCRDIVLYCLLQHASHLMQPCDLKLFSSLKESSKQAVCDFQIANVGEYVTKSKFAAVFKHAWGRSTSLEISIKAFCDGRLFPLDPRKVLGTLKMKPSTIFEQCSTSPSKQKSDRPADQTTVKPVTGTSTCSTNPTVVVNSTFVTPVSQVPDNETDTSNIPDKQPSSNVTVSKSMPDENQPETDIHDILH